MDALWTGLLIFGGFIAVIAVWSFVDMIISDKTGISLDKWVATFFWVSIFVAIGFGGISIVRYGMAQSDAGGSGDGVLAVVFGIIVVLVGFGMAVGSWSERKN